MAKKKYTAAQKAAYAKRMRSKRGKKPTKGQLVSARAPIVECKKYEVQHDSFRLSESSSSVTPAVDAYLKMFQGLQNDQYVGNSIFSKYVSMKLEFSWPQENFAVTGQYRVQLIHGWVTAPLGYAKTPLNAYVPARNTVTEAEIEKTIAARVTEAFDSSTDIMEFRDKEKRLYKILGKQWLKPNRKNQIGAPQNSAVLVDGMSAEDYVIGGPPKVFKQLNWRTHHKVRLTNTFDSTTQTAFGYPNESNMIPFVVIYTPDHANLINNANPENPPSDDYLPNVRMSTCHWFTDS